MRGCKILVLSFRHSRCHLHILKKLEDGLTGQGHKLNVRHVNSRFSRINTGLVTVGPAKVKAYRIYSRISRPAYKSN